MIPQNRITSNLFELAKGVSILQVAQELGFDLKKQGQNYVATCPFHTEKTPSFMVFPGTNSFKCFGCGEYGDVITLVAKVKNISPLQAAKELAGDIPPVNAIQLTKIRQERQAGQDLKEIRDHVYQRLCVIYRAIHLAVTPENLGTDWMSYWIRRLPAIEEALDNLSSENVELQIKTLSHGGIKKLCGL